MHETALVCDLDGFFYPYNDKFHGFSQEASITTPVMLFAQARQELTPRAAVECAWRSFKQSSDCYSDFLPLAEATGFNREAYRRLHCEDFYRRLTRITKTCYPDFLTYDAELVEAFRDAGPQLRCGVLTHSFMDPWGHYVLEEMGVRQFFQQDALWGLDQYNFVHKHESAEPLRAMIRHLEAEPEQTIFGDDSLRNLERAKREIPEVKTAYAHHGRPLDVMPPYVDYQFVNLAALVREVARTGMRPAAARTYGRALTLA